MATTVDIRITAVAETNTDTDGQHLVRMSVDGEPETTAPLGSLEDMDRFTGLFERNTSAAEREKAGDALFAALFGGELAARWAKVTAAADPDQPTRVCLDIEPPELRYLPWELLRNQERWLFRRADLLWRRSSVPAQAAKTPQPQPGEAAKESTADCELGPMRVLVVVCNPREHRMLAEKELAWICGTFDGLPGRTHVEVQDGPSRPELAERIDQLRPHILHFIGHGMPRPGQSTVLHFNWKAGPGDTVDWNLSAGQIADMTRWKPRLVVVNACRTADAAPTANAEGRIQSLAHAFLEAGSKAVASMQADIDSPDAVRFSASLYRAIGEGHDVDEAVAQARQALELNEGRPSDAWALPVLVTQVLPESVLPIIHDPLPPSTVKAIERRQSYRELRRFVGRALERRAAWWALDHPNRSAATGAERPLVVISGHSETGYRKTGKTLLAEWCLAVCFLRGHRAISVRLDGGTKDWLTVVTEIRRQAVGADQLTPLPAETFDEFDMVLARLFPGSPGSSSGPAAQPGNGPLPDVEARSGGRLWFNDEAGHADERRNELLDCFLSSLRKAAQGKPMVIALDPADRIQAELFTGWLYERLILPIARGDASPLRLILVASKDWLADALPRADRHLIGEVALGDFESAQLMRLVRAYGNRLGYPVDEQVEQVVAGLQASGAYTRVNVFDQLISVFPQWYTADERGA
ncbi:CHAT domain-containing protein [Streptomyces sp. NPDC048275]|uniref:CHAT domain-containing protein n=1 Tax=Streptomyces sp. NPDC048275 TaxID=3155629 RepID=UPI0033FCF376